MKRVSLILLVLALFFAPAQEILADQVYPGQGVSFHQMDFVFEVDPDTNSRWGRAMIDVPALLTSQEIYSSGYINVRTMEGWVVYNVPIDSSSPTAVVGVYFDLGPEAQGTQIPYLWAFVNFSVDPLTSFPGGEPFEYDMGQKIQFSAAGLGESDPMLSGAPPLPFPDRGAPQLQTYACYQPGHTNVEAAWNQCAPMAVANSYDYLRNRYGLAIPDPHVPGHRGDNTLVGRIDEFMDRTVYSRTSGYGVNSIQWLKGKLGYIADAQLGDKLIFKHQGSGYSMPAGDYTHAGLTSYGKGTTVTAAWLIDEVCKGEDVEIGYQHAWGGHCVMLVAAGYTNGVPWIEYAHDAQQAPNDAIGLEVVHTTLEDLDFDGTLNMHRSNTDELLCATSESIKNRIFIEKCHYTHQGLHEYVDLTFESGEYEMGGFDFLIAYDASALGLQSAIPGPAFYDPAPDGCGWEYFTYRYGPFGNCGDACPSGMVRVLGLAETNNGPNHPDCFLPDSLPAVMFTLDFLVSNDRTLECQYVPIRFFWTDCGDNTVSSVAGDTLFVSDHVYEFEGTDITDSTFGFPTYFGVQPHCFNPDPDKPTAIQLVDFWNGGVDIICADSIDDRGDINLNGTANEIADAVLFSNYFVHGISVFNVNIDGQIAASDVNADGITLSVADLVYQIRIITGDALPYPKLSPVTADADLVDGVLSVNTEMGAAYVVVENSMTPLLLAELMEMKYHYDEDNNLTRILVYSMEPDRRFSGDFLGGIDGNVMTLEMATYEGTPVTTKLVPEAFALYPCYPNPFNPITTISFALAAPVDYELVIYNALGQTVETFSGRSGPGLERIDWDASALASGVYFYRLTAGDFNDTKKMVLLK